MTLPGIDSIDVYGGVLGNYAPVVDPTTDLDAGADNKNRASTAMVTHTAWRAVRSFVGHASTPTDPSTGFVHDAVWGSESEVKPTVAVSATGVYDVTWPATVQDELGETHTVVLRAGTAQVSGSTPYFVQAEATSSPNKWRVRIFTSAGAASAAAVTITLWVM